LSERGQLTTGASRSQGSRSSGRLVWRRGLPANMAGRMEMRRPRPQCGREFGGSVRVADGRPCGLSERQPAPAAQAI